MLKRAFIRYVATLLDTCGIKILKCETRRYTRYLLLIAASFYSLAVPLTCIYAVLNRDDFYKFTIPIPYIAVVSITMSNFLSICYNREILGEMLFNMDRNLYVYPDEHSLQIDYQWYLQEKNIKIILKTIRGFYMISVCLRSLPAFVQVFWYNSTETLLYPGWIPWSLEKKYLRCTAVLLQFGQALCGIFCHNLVVVCILTPVFEFSRQFKRLKVAIEGIEIRALARIQEHDEKDEDRVMRESIVHCIKHHQALRKNFKLFKVWMQLILSCDMFICTLSLAFGLYVVVNASSFLKIFDSVEVIGVITMNLLAICIFGEIFSDLSDDVALTIFWKNHWYGISEENRKLVVIFHSMASRPLDLFAFSIFRANRLVYSEDACGGIPFTRRLVLFRDCSLIVIMVMIRRIFQYVDILFANFGINVSNDRVGFIEWKIMVIFVLFTLAGISTFMVSLTNTDDFYTFINPSPYVAAATVLQSGVYFIYRYRKIVGVMFDDMDRNMYTYPDEYLMEIDYPWYLQEDNVVSLMTMAKYLSFFMLFTVCLPIFGELVYYRRINTFIYPYWVPWTAQGLRYELLMFLFQFSQGVCGIWLNYLIAIFLYTTVTEFIRQYRRLVIAVLSLKSRSGCSFSKQIPIDRGFQGLMRGNIIHCIKHHQVLHKNFSLFKIWFSTFFSLELAISVVTFAFALFVMTNASSLGQVVNYFTVVSFIWFNLLIRCLISEIFSHLNNTVSEALFWNVQWYEMDKENRQLLLMLHLMTCRPLRLFGLSIFEATRVTFAKLIRITYSIFNVLNLSLNK